MSAFLTLATWFSNSATASAFISGLIDSVRAKQCGVVDGEFEAEVVEEVMRHRAVDSDLGCRLELRERPRL